MSSACVPSQTRWEAIRASSDMITRQYWARSGASTPHSFSTASTQPRLFIGAAT